MTVPVSYEVAMQMFEDAEPGSPELDEATKLRAGAFVREFVNVGKDDGD